LPPQQPRGQQQRKPAQIKKKLHTKRPGHLEETTRPGRTASRGSE
jgi:hypothetical protein